MFRIESVIYLYNIFSQIILCYSVFSTEKETRKIHLHVALRNRVLLPRVINKPYVLKNKLTIITLFFCFESSSFDANE
ncbi:hypothetical protein BLOT_004194 [Blomia tropicalis]|nr:hypothetical protein BLOT_004194 [Blomia tropicalis]